MPTKTEILNKALKAASEATYDIDSHTTYLDHWGDDRNEPWIHSYLLVMINDLMRSQGAKDGIYVTSEAKASWLWDNTNSDRSNESELSASEQELTSKQRFDLAVWNRGGLVWGLIEVKDAPGIDDNRLRTDLNKLMHGLNLWGAPKGSLRWGLYVFSNRCWNTQAPDRQGALDIRHKARVEVLKSCLPDEFISLSQHLKYDEDEYPGATVSWSGFLISKKRT